RGGTAETAEGCPCDVAIADSCTPMSGGPAKPRVAARSRRPLQVGADEVEEDAAPVNAPQDSPRGDACMTGQYAPWQFFPLRLRPQVHGSLRPRRASLRAYVFMISAGASPAASSSAIARIGCPT